jgi:hypothetical protein
MLVSSAPGWSPRAVEEEEEEEEESEINEIKIKYFGIICILFFHKKKLYYINWQNMKLCIKYFDIILAFSHKKRY